MDRLKDKVAIVTGAAGGIGEAIARLFADEGARVLATDIQEENLKLWVHQAQQAGQQIEYALHDVASRTDWQSVITKALSLYGKVDILVNNAGIYPAGATTENTTDDLWNKVTAVNLTGPFIGTQLCIPHMKENNGGAIVNISSIAGIVGGNGAAYSATKGGLKLLTKDQAVEFAKDNIRVNAIHPGGILTPMTDFIGTAEEANELMKDLCPMGRLGNVMEIAYGALYLASDESSYTTGIELVIDGGLVAR
ncbi:glucose 1-dehydrogenase [Olivibacter sp. SDN3]|uniref:SDR family NAD(P)-dependent oxidoreductase n=1 Tax=Olivibacter sp. SDN3 TaxID=2764720 RepID=UPI001650E6B1|nr:glucose 1-dehydrogenase [Olivibacter sp. SDN3]QNL51643.1 glucose 1-dehydrogenase [Olivibacter sp. SDN3]